MKTKLILQSDWPTFFDRFSQHYRGSLVSLEILSPEIGAQVEEQELEFNGITEELDEIKGNTLIVMMGTKVGNHITHNITRPMEVSLEQTDEGIDVALAIKTPDGTTALLRMTPTMLPERVAAAEVPACRTS